MKEVRTGKWLVTHDEEMWYDFDEFDSKEEAIKFGRECYPHQDFYVGQIYKVYFEDNEFIGNDERIIDDLSDTLYEFCGEGSVSWWEKITTEQENELNDMINKTIFEWIQKNNLQPTCFVVENIALVMGDYEYED